MHKLLLTSILLLSTLTLACDAPAEPHSTEACILGPTVPAPGIAFREEGPPEGLYTYTLGDQPIHRAEFQKFVSVCDGQLLDDPALAITYSWRKPDVTKDERVVGVCFSMLAGSELFSCYEDVMLEQNPVKF